MADPNNVKSIFLAASEKPPAERAAFLSEVVNGDTALRVRVEALLRAHDNPDSFLKDAAAEFGATIDLSPAEVLLAERPGTLIGPYKLLEQIGEGGMGVVYMADQQAPVRRRVALKIIKAGMDTRQVIARFEAERQALALMDHSNIARVLDAGATDTGRPYFVMELVKGVPVTEYCDAHNLSIPKRLELFAQVCQAVQHAHQKGLIHRDIKPSNVLVSTQDDRPVAKVIDFGVAKAVQGQLTEKTLFTEFQHLVGTPAYMSPEQAGGSLDIDTRSDVYSLGVLLYELLAGTPPFDPNELRSKTLAEMQRIIREVEPPTPSTRLKALDDTLATVAAQRSIEPRKLAAMVHGELDWIVMKALEKDRNRRYESANGLAMDLQRYLHDEAVAACPPSVGYRLRKFFRRNKSRLSIAALILLPLVLLGGGIVWAARDRVVRQAVLEQGVTAALSEVEAWHQRENWPDAIAALKHAEALLATGQPSPALAARVAQWRTDVKTATRLEEIRLSDTTTEWAFWRERPAAHADYQREFHSLGVDIDAMTVDEVAERIRARPIRDQLIAALDGWTTLRLLLVSDNSETARDKPKDWWQRPLVVACAADTDEYRKRVRLAVQENDKNTLVEMAQSPNALRLPASTLVLLATHIGPNEFTHTPLEIDLLKRAQQSRPDDFYITYSLATLRQDDSNRSRIATIGGTIARGRRFENDSFLGSEAIAYARAAVALRPKSAWARGALAVALHRANRLDEAIAVFHHAIRIKPDYYACHSNLGLALFEKGDYDNAIAAQRKASELQPKSAVPYIHIGLIREAQGKFDEAIAAFRKATDLEPARFETHDLLGTMLSDRGRLDEGIAEIRTAIKIDPNEPFGYYNLGMSLGRQGKLDESIAALRKAIKLNPNYPEAYNGLGALFCNHGKLDDAVGAYRKAIEFDPDYAFAYYNLADTLRQLGRTDEAIVPSHKAIELAPNGQFAAAAYCILASALSNEGKLDEAIGAYRKAIDRNPAHAPAYYSLGIVLTAQGKLDEAIDAYRKVIEIQPQFAVGYNGLAWLLATAPKQQDRDPDRAVELAAKAVELAPKEGSFWNTLGVARYQAGQWQGAIDALAKSTEMHNGGNASDWFFLAMAHWQLGNKDEARKLYDKAVAWMDKNQTKNEQLLRFRMEAAELLGISEPAKSTDAAPQP